MIDSLLLRVVSKWATPFLIVFAFYFFAQGHNLPGGGFVAGLLLSGAFALRLVADKRSDNWLTGGTWAEWSIILGLVICFLSGLLAVLKFDFPFLTGLWSTTSLPFVGKIGTPLLFDFGVMILVFSVAAGLLSRFARGWDQ